MSDPSIATAADYADALLTARRAKNGLVLLILLCLLAQLALFFLIRYNVLNVAVASASTTQPAGGFNSERGWHFLVGFSVFFGLITTIVLGFVLLLIVNIMLVGRLIGVGRLTGAYVWAVVLLFLLFPWQSFLNNVGLTPDKVTFKVPGVLYTWYELVPDGAHFPTSDPIFAAIKWARFVGFPILAIIILLNIQIKSNRGLRQALGEDDLHDIQIPTA